MAVLYCCLLGLFAVARSMLWTYGTDTGIFIQATASVLRGYLDGPEAGTHFCYHWSPILAVLSPIVWLVHSDLSIQLSQVVLIAAAAFPMYALVRRYTDEKTAFYAALWTFLYAPLFSIACEEFHELAFYPVLALALVETADRGAWKSFALAACGAMLVREDALLVNAACGLMLVVIGLGYVKPNIGAGMHGKRDVVIAGTAIAFCSLAVMFGYFHILIPAIGRWSPTHFYSYPFANGPGELIIAIIKNPPVVGALYDARASDIFA